MSDNDYGYFGDGLDGYAHYMQTFNDNFSSDNNHDDDEDYSDEEDDCEVNEDCAATDYSAVSSAISNPTNQNQCADKNKSTQPIDYRAYDKLSFGDVVGALLGIAVIVLLIVWLFY